MVAWGVADAIYLYQDATSHLRRRLPRLAVAGRRARDRGRGRSLSEALDPRAARDGYSMLFPALFAAVAVGVLAWDHLRTALHEVSIWLAVGDARGGASAHGAQLPREPACSAPSDTTRVTDCADRARQPALADRRPRPGRRSGESDARLRALRPRRLQGLQRQLRPPRRRHPAAPPRRRTWRPRWRPRGRAYRLGGDEFCVLVPRRPRAGPSVLALAGEAALTERGEGFRDQRLGGRGDALRRGRRRRPTALRLADRRMYAEKGRTLELGPAPDPRRAGPGPARARAGARAPTCEGVARLAAAIGRGCGPRRGGARRRRSRRRAARHRQDRDPRRDPAQARPARRRRVGR